MKHLKNYLFLFLFLTALAACKEDDDQPDSPNYGIEYFECKINGEPFQAVSDFSCSGPRFEYYPEAFMSVPAGYMQFGGRDCRDDRALYLSLFGTSPEAHGFTSLENMSYADSCTPTFFFSDLTTYQNLIDGSLNIEEFTPRESGTSSFGVMRGTFELRLTNDQNTDTLNITEGRFNYDVPQIF
jgi:hypothetical protein